MPNKIYKVIGLMSGTSLDGVDAALIATDGENIIKSEGFLTVPYDENLRKEIRACFGLAPSDVKVKTVERSLTQLHARAVKKLLEMKGLQPKDIDLVGFHGQTIGHAPEKGYTTQIGDGALLAQLTGVSVVNDFRTADVKAGGQGAPLVPIYHQALSGAMEKPVVFLNIGGVANVTYVGSDGKVIAFDTGPGNALIDDWMLKKTGRTFDAGGKVALSGKVDEAVLKQLLSHSFFTAPVPKSLDRNAFAGQAWKYLNLADGAATLGSFTARSIAMATPFFPEAPKKWIVAGGGRHNVYLMQQLQKNIPVPVEPIDALGWDGDAIEAEAFGYLAVRSVRGLPYSFPQTTGVKQPMTGGVLHAI
jgi:anhydro-N-acetylmuramic acid kinase